MSHFSRFALAALVAASLAPAAAQARSAGSQPAAANQQLVALQSAPAAQAQGRAAERTTQPAAYAAVPAQPQYAVASDDGYLG